MGYLKRVLSVVALWMVLMLSVQAAKVTYVYTDPQGTSLAEADANGNIVATFDYKPYGLRTLGSPSDGPGYTGHVNDPDTGLTYMQARYYDPDVMRFLSTDPVGVGGANVFRFNRYAYANNNPILNIDPDGRNSIVVYRADGSINISVPIKFSGAAATEKNISAIKSDVQSKWSGLYNVAGGITLVTVSVVDVTPNTPAQAVNHVALLNGPTSDKASNGASFVREHNNGEWDTTAPEWSTGAGPHEVGHLMGAEDHYTSWFNSDGVRKSSPSDGWKNNLMSDLSPTTGTNNIDEILNFPNNVTRFEPAPPPPPPPTTGEAH